MFRRRGNHDRIAELVDLLPDRKIIFIRNCLLPYCMNGADKEEYLGVRKFRQLFNDWKQGGWGLFQIEIVHRQDQNLAANVPRHG